MKIDKVLRRLCGWITTNKIPCAGTFSNAFYEFSALGIPEIAHKFLIQSNYREELVGHVCRDATKIQGREKPLKKEYNDKKVKDKKKRGRRKKGEPIVEKDQTRIEKQLGMTLEQMLEDITLSKLLGS